VVSDLERFNLLSVIQTRDTRIAELEASLAQRDDTILKLFAMGAREADAVRQARAEVPEWCRELVRGLLACDEGDVCDELTPDQLKALGIDGTRTR
jgi:uncharacterized coiled-coil protein SlyX